MDFWIAIALVLLNIADDALAVLYIRRTAAGRAVQAAIISAALTAIVAFSVIQYVDNRLYLIPIVSGSAAGSFLAVKIDRTYKKRKKVKQNAKRSSKTKKGKGIVSLEKSPEARSNHEALNV